MDPPGPSDIGEVANRGSIASVSLQLVQGQMVVDIEDEKQQVQPTEQVHKETNT